VDYVPGSYKPPARPKVEAAIPALAVGRLARGRRCRGPLAAAWRIRNGRNLTIDEATYTATALAGPTVSLTLTFKEFEPALSYLRQHPGPVVHAGASLLQEVWGYDLLPASTRTGGTCHVRRLRAQARRRARAS